MELPDNLQLQLDSIFDESEKYFGKQNFRKCIELHEKAWGLFPEPKFQYHNEGYSLVEGLVDLNIKAGDLEAAQAWAEKLQHFNQQHFFGTTEFAMGKALYEAGDLDAAKQQFATAMEKSEGRVFDGEDKKYLVLLKKK